MNQLPVRTLSPSMRPRNRAHRSEHGQFGQFPCYAAFHTGKRQSNEMHSLTIDRQQVDEQMWLGREQVYDIVQYLRVLLALIGVDDK
jgi:hypothetical protein